MFGHIWFNETNMAEAKTNGDVSKREFPVWRIQYAAWIQGQNQHFSLI